MSEIVTGEKMETKIEPLCYGCGFNDQFKNLLDRLLAGLPENPSPEIASALVELSKMLNNWTPQEKSAETFESLKKLIS